MATQIETATKFGFAMHTRFSGVYIDLVHTVNGKLQPIVIVPDRIGYKNDTHEAFVRFVEKRAVIHENWVARRAPTGTEFNTHHPSYIRAILAMRVLSADECAVVLYNCINNNFFKFSVKYNEDHYKTIIANEFCFSSLYQQTVNDASMVIPQLLFDDGDDDVLDSEQQYKPLGTYTKTVFKPGITPPAATYSFEV